ncbi:MAG: histidine phosphatase family protein [Haloglomus sp.]
MTTVVLLRHGQTEWNRTRRIQGWAASPLNDRGREQARVAGQHIAETYDCDRVVASDLRRTRETTALVRQQGDFPEPAFTRGWRERSFGDLQGLTYGQVFGDFPEHNAANGVMALESAPPRGESMLEARERVLDAWSRLLVDGDPDDTVLVVTHGGPIYVLLAHLRERDLPSALTDFHQHNCACNELRYDHERETTDVVRENDVSYRDDEAIEAAIGSDDG